VRPGATRVESFGSYWFLDDDAGEYLRMPKQEGPRERGPNGEDWGGPDADEGLQDLKWHPMYGWEKRNVGPIERLVIFVDPDHELVVTAPLRGVPIDWVPRMTEVEA
jgi:hypothetical protein